jgi:pimeloyl-ACP methyl ester carboxylesterase
VRDYGEAAVSVGVQAQQTTYQGHDSSGKFEPMEAAVPNLRRIVLLPRCGHWTQQERPLDVSGELLDFLHREGRS